MKTPKGGRNWSLNSIGWWLNFPPQLLSARRQLFSIRWGIYLLAGVALAFPNDVRAQEPPYLSAIMLAGGTACVVWPSAFGGVTLESAHLPGGPWSDVAATPSGTGDSFQVCVPVLGAQQFFRLRTPPGEGLDIYSVNILGYQNYFIPVSGTNFTRITNSFVNADSTIASLIPNPPEGTVVYKSGTIANAYDFGEWSDPGMILNPGSAFDVFAPSSFTLTLAGEWVAAPEIYSVPANLSVPAGTNLTLHVVATGSRPLTYQWLFNDLPMIGATSATLNLSSVAANQAGNYSVVVTNAFGAVTSVVATLSVTASTVTFPDPNLESVVRQVLNKPSGGITPADMLTMANLQANDRGIRDTSGLEAARNLQSLDLGGNAMTNFSGLKGLSQLKVLYLYRDGLTNISFVSDLTNLQAFHAENNDLTDLVALSSLTNLTLVSVYFNHLQDVSPLTNLPALTYLSLDWNPDISNHAVLSILTNLTELDLAGNHLTNISFIGALTQLEKANFYVNEIRDVSPLANLARLKELGLRANAVTNASLLSALAGLRVLDLGDNSALFDNRLGDISFLSGLTNLEKLDIDANYIATLSPLASLKKLWLLNARHNDITSLAPLASATNLMELYLTGNSITSLAPLTSTPVLNRLEIEENLIVDVSPLLSLPALNSANLKLNLLDTNTASRAMLVVSNLQSRGVSVDYLPQRTPTPNLVWISPGTFTMGSATDEPASTPNEDPQTQVTLTRGFWMSKYEVTQGEFESLMGSNPSHFTGDTNRPVDQVSWLQASNYCVSLTQSEKAAGRLPDGYVYRLPTEAEWEYACRAGTTTRFSFGDNPADLPAYGWFILNSGCDYANDPTCASTGSTHPVGQKLPNPWGLYDMHGNVGEFVLDWSGNYSGGSVTNPVGPASGPNKIFRAPAWDFGDIYSGSATRWDYPVGPGDDSIGFRVALAEGAVIEFSRTNYVMTEMISAFYADLRRTGDPTLPVSVRLRSFDGTAQSQGFDFYGPVDQVITFNPGETNKTIFVTYIVDNALPEGEENFRLELSEPGMGAVLGTRTNASVLLLDDDSPSGAGFGLNEQVQDLAIQTDGRIIAVGGFFFANGVPRADVARFNANLSLDGSFNPTPGANAWTESVALQADGKIIVGGHFSAFNNVSRGHVARVNSDGSLDTTFAPSSGANDSVYEVHSTQTNKVLIGGAFTAVNGVARSGVARLNNDGSLDATFNPGSGAGGPVPGFNGHTIWAITEQTNGQILVSGEFTTFNGVARNFLARLNPDGSLDGTFTNALNGIANTLVIQPDGKILLGGWFTAINGITRNRIARLNADGTLDSTFDAGGGPDGTPWDLALQSDGKILVAGAYFNWNGDYHGGLVRLDTNGVLDASFNVGPGANSWVMAVGVLPDGRLAAGGLFNNFNGYNRYRLVVLNPDGTQNPEPLRWTQWRAADGGNDHWYAFTSRPGTWAEAEVEAVASGGHLVSVNSAAEQAFLERTCLADRDKLRPFWTGLNDAASEGSFVWSSGEPVTYLNWSPDQPDPSPGNAEDYVALNWVYSWNLADPPASFGAWNDVPASGYFSASYGSGPHFGIMETSSTPPPASALLAHAQDFEGAVGPEWSSTNTSVTPISARRFLGELGNQTVTLTLTNLPSHTVARVSFHLYIIRSWDGSSAVAGPDVWRLAVNGGAPVIQTSFGTGHPYSVAGGQAFPGSYPGAVFAVKTGAVETNSLGYTFSDAVFNGPLDNVYRLEPVFLDASTNLALAFSASGLQALTDESWGIDNVSVELFNFSTNDLERLTLAPLSPLYPGDPNPTQASLIASFPGVTDLDVTSSAVWSSGDSNIFSINAAGQLQPRAAGSAALIASYMNLSATTTVTVLAPVTLRQNSPATVTVGGSSKSAPLFADFPGSSNINITAFTGVTRISSDATIATISGGGTITALKPGFVMLTATYAGLTNQMPLDVAFPPGGTRFYETNLVVVRVGDGAQSLATTGNSVFLDQFTTTGEYVDTVGIPDAGPNGVVMSGSSFVEGYLTRSLDRSLLSLAVYGTNLGSGANVTTSTNVPRVVATFDAASIYDQAVRSANDYSGVAWRSAATDGTNNFWGAGASGGTIYLGNASPRAVVQNSKPNDRVVEIFNGNLFMASGSTAGDSRTGIYRFAGLPKTTVDLPAAIIFTNTFVSPGGIGDFAVSPDERIIYFCDDRSPSGIVGGVQRWDFDSLNNSWTNSYNLTNGLGASGTTHVEVDWNGPHPVVYATTSETSRNRLVRVTDQGAFSMFVELATAGTNQIFRGVKFGPVVTAPAILGVAGGKIEVVGDASALWPAGTTFNGFTSGSADPLSPLQNTAVHFRGWSSGGNGSDTLNGAYLIYRYRLEFPSNVVIDSIKLSGQAFNGANSVFRLLNAGGTPIAAWVTSGGNTYQTFDWTPPHTEGSVFFVEEYDTSATWRFRDSLQIHATPVGPSAPPQSLVYETGQSMLLDVVAAGTGPLNYQWQRNGVNLAGATAPTLAVTNIQVASEGNYGLVLAGAGGATTSIVASVTVHSSPPSLQSIVGGVASLQVASALWPVGTTYGGQVAASADPLAPLFNVPVQFRGFNAGGNTTDVLNGANLIYRYRLNLFAPVMIDAIHLSGEAFNGSNAAFRLRDLAGNVLATRATSGGNSYQSFDWSPTPAAGTAFYLEEYDSSGTWRYRDSLRFHATPVSNSSLPQTFSFQNGDYGFLQAGVTGTGPLTYQWRFNGQEISGATGATLFLTDIRSTDAGDYSIVVNGALGTITNLVAHVVVDQTPGFTRSLLAYEGFNYGGSSDLSGEGGGYGWSNNWSSNIVGDSVIASGASGSLTYTDALGNALLTSGNAFFYSAASLASGDSRTFRNLSVTRGADNTTTWISFLGQRTGPTTNLTANPYPRGATPISLYNGNAEKLAIGNATGVSSNTWALVPAGQGANLRSSANSFSDLSLVVVRIDHKPGNDDAYLFINPVLDREPQPGEAAAQSLGAFDFSFNRVRPFVGANDAANGRPYAELFTDEIRIGETYASVTPFLPSGTTNTVYVYHQDFENGAGSEWNNTNVSVTPIGGRRFLGEFGNQTVQLSLTGMPAHNLMRLSFDLFVLRTWDGNYASAGPDVFRLTRSDGTQYFRNTFNNHYAAGVASFGSTTVAAGQTFPGTYVTAANSPTFAPQTGAEEVNTLGYLWTGTPPLPQDAVYRLSRVVAHSGANVTFSFNGSGLEALANESWGLDNVRMELFNFVPGSAQSLAFLAPPPVFYPGYPVAFETALVSRYTNGVTLEVSHVSGVSYTSRNTNNFTVSTVGEISPLNPGTTNLVATYLGLSATTTVTVLAPVALRQVGPSVANAGDVANINLFADFPDTTNLNVTAFNAITRISSDTTVATYGAGGAVVLHKPGSVMLTAIYGGLTNQMPLAVVFPPGFKPGALANRYSFGEAPNTTTVADSVGGANGELIHLAAGAATNNFTGSGELNLGGGAGGSATAAYVNLPNGLVSGHQSLTIEGWVTWFGASGSTWQRIFDFGRNLATDGNADFVEDQFNSTGAGFMFLTPRASSGRARFAIKQSTGTETPVIQAGSAMTVSNQTHFAIVYDPPSGVARLYVNGQRVATAAAFLPLSEVEDRNVWLGRSQWSPDPFFNGLFNEFRIYDGALLDQEVQASYAAGPDNFVGAIARPPNDDLANATPLSGPIISAVGANVGATAEPGETSNGKSVWWRWQADEDGPVALDNIGSSFYGKLTVAIGNTVSNLAEVPITYSDASNSPYAPAQQGSFVGLAGTNYYISVDARNPASDSTGRVVLHLTASWPPQVFIAPGTQTVSAGYDARFDALAAGVTGPFAYQWQRSGSNLSGATNPFLSLANVQVQTAGNYRVLATGSGPTTGTSADVVLTVQAPYQLNTFAGLAGSAGNVNGTTNARFNQPHDLTMDAAGNVYVVEMGNDVVRKITPAGVVSTLAGLAGNPGAADGTGSAARFNNPWGVCVDSSGNLFVADAFNHSIRRITPGGAVTTFAGTLGASGSADGVGSAARFNTPRDIVIDPSGNLFVADFNNHTIRKITPAGVVTTIAGRAGIAGSMDGTGAGALFFNPSTLALDPSGNLFVAEELNHTIRKLTQVGTNWVVTLFAGKPGHAGQRDGVGTDARFNAPSGLAADSLGNLFLVEPNSCVLRKIDPSGLVSTLVGLPGVSGSVDGVGRLARATTLRGVAVDAGGTLYLADWGNHNIRKAAPSAGIEIQQQPSDVTVSEDGGADLSAQVTGRGPFAYQWFHNGALLNGATQAVLHLDHLLASQSGQYQLRIRTLDGVEEYFSDNVSLVVRKRSWQFSGTPGLGLGVGLSDVWARNASEAYALGWKRRGVRVDVPDSYLYHWDGNNWSWLTSFPGHYARKVFGTGSNELWVALSRCTLGASAGCGLDHGGIIYHSLDGGTTWTEQGLPVEAMGREILWLGGSPGNIQAVAEGGMILRFDGLAWSTIFSDPIESVNAVTLLEPGEGYYVTCWGWGAWDGNQWRFHGRQFDFCDVNATWAIRDGTGELQWYAVGANNQDEGVRVWRFDSTSESFGGKTNFVFSDGEGIDLGRATGIWGSAADDVYVIGELAGASSGARHGRVYHFDGSAWSPVVDFGEIPPPMAIHGTARDNVWLALADGRLLHWSSRAGTNDPPVITTPPQDQHVVINTTGRFSVAAQGTPPLRYQWWFNTVALAGATEPVLMLPAVQLTNAGSFRVSVANSFGGVTSAPVNLFVVVPPGFSKQPAGTNIIVGSGLTLSVTVTNADEYQWRKNGANIAGATNSTYTIPSATYADGGSYTVVVANDAGAVTSDQAEVIVLPPAPPDAQDDFSKRLSLSLVLTGGPPVVVSGFSTNATKESFEPDHAGRRGGRSVWYSWTPASDGIARFNTYGSTFDTVLAVYTGNALSNLVTVAANDDDDGNDPLLTTNRFFASEVRFNAHAGTNYAVAVDGFGGASGYYVMFSEFEISSQKLPEILVQPDSQVERLGSNVTFNLTASGANLAYQWYFQGLPAAGETASQWTRANIGSAELGTYSVRVRDTNTGRYTDSRRVVLEISSDPAQGAALQDKLERLVNGAPLPRPPSTTGARPLGREVTTGFYSVSAGTVGYHLGNNVEGRTDLNEVNHAGLIGNASMYLSLETTNAGTLVVDTRGSGIDNLFAVYLDNVNYDQLASGLLGYATNAASSANVNSVTVTNGPAGGQYLIVADGVKGRRGYLQINWSFGTAPAARPVTNAVALQTVNPGGNLTLQVNDPAVTNAVPKPTYRWYRDDQFLVETTVPFLFLTQASLTNSGTYRVISQNGLGTTTNVLTRLLLSQPLNVTKGSGGYRNGVFSFTLNGTEGDSVVVQATTNLIHWQDLSLERLAGYERTYQDTQAGKLRARYYRAVREGSFSHLAGSLAVVDSGMAPGAGYRLTMPPSIEVPILIESSTDLVNWVTIKTNPLNATATTFTDPAATNAPSRYYRLRLTR